MHLSCQQSVRAMRGWLTIPGDSSKPSRRISSKYASLQEPALIDIINEDKLLSDKSSNVRGRGRFHVEGNNVLESDVWNIKRRSTVGVSFGLRSATTSSSVLKYSQRAPEEKVYPQKPCTVPHSPWHRRPVASNERARPKGRGEVEETSYHQPGWPRNKIGIPKSRRGCRK